MKECIQADLDDAGAFRSINENHSENLVCIVHALAQLFGGHENNSERPLCIVHAPAQLVFFLVNMHHVRVFIFATLNGL